MPYMGFAAVEKSAAGARDPGAVAASIGRKKYGKKAYQEHAAKGETMEHVKPLHGSNRTAKEGASALAHRRK